MCQRRIKHTPCWVAARTDSDDQVKRCYRQRVQEYHPDKIAAKGLPDEFTRFAHDKFREIQDAWEQIKAARGIK
jgi:DnaJ like chaperone protein